MARFIMILVIGAIITYGYTSITLNEYTSQGTKNAVDNFSYNRAHDIANGMLEIVLMRLANDNNYVINGTQSEALFDGQVTYSAHEEFFEGDTLIKVMVSANYNGVTKNITTYTERRTSGGWVPHFVRAAWTANADLNNTISDMYIDGRNHDLDLNIIPNTGRLGVSSGSVFTNVDRAAIGGTADSVDYPMSYPENPAVVEQFYDWGSNYPETPDEILGFPEGTLKSVAQSGVDGSQYLLNPKDKINEDDNITFPLSGVTYIEITDGLEREFEIEDFGNKGILVVHGPNRTSRVKKITMAEADERFTGLFITDYSFHHHLDILGGVLMLSPNLEDEKGCGGNKDHWVYYSSEAIANATEIASEVSGEIGNNNSTGGYGFAQKRMDVRFVYE